MTVRVNGRVEEVGERETLAGLLERLGVGSPYALVERNGAPVERSRYAETELADGDSLVVARPVAGG